MEYDNDRVIKPVYNIEIFYWVLLVLMNPLVNGITVFFYQTGEYGWYFLSLAWLCFLRIFYIQG